MNFQFREHKEHMFQFQEDVPDLFIYLFIYLFNC